MPASISWHQTLERKIEMNTATHRPTIIGGLVLVLLLGAGAYFAFRWLAGAFAIMDAQIGVVTTVAAVVILLSAAGIARAIRRAKRAETLPPLSGERVALYDRILRAWAVLVAEEGCLADEAVKRLKADLAALESGLVLIASPEVISAYLALRGGRGGSPQENGQFRSHLGRLAVAMRGDLVSNAPGLDENELLAVLLNAADLPAAKAAEPDIDSRPARSPEDLRPRVSLAVPS